MGRHKNPQYNRKRLVVAGVAAVTTLGVAVGIGIYGSALADRGQESAASQECLPTPPSASAPPSSTTEPPPSETAPPETTPTETATDTATETATETATDTATETATDTATDTATETAPTETAPSETAAPEESAAEGAPDGWGSDRLLAMNGERPRGGQPSSPPDYGGPAPSETVPAPPSGAPQEEFPAGEECEDPLGPFPEDFIDIRRVPRSELGRQEVRGGSTGTFVSQCGRNENGHFNSANFIVSPGNVNGAEHTHDHVGNLSTDGFSTNESLEAAGTTCRLGDKSTYFWPIIRVRNEGSTAVDPLNAHNVGDPVLPASVQLLFRGNPSGPVVAAPKFLRVLTGAAKAFTQNGLNQNAKWTCTGFENRITAKYPLCPRGSQLVRIADFPGCWDGQNTDSANHRTHVAFADAAGTCPEGFVAIPQLRITLKYNLPRGKVFALDAFPAEKHSPVTDHNDFVNVMPEQLMNRVVQCINTGRRC